MLNVHLKRKKEKNPNHQEKQKVNLDSSVLTTVSGGQKNPPKNPSYLISLVPSHPVTWFINNKRYTLKYVIT